MAVTQFYIFTTLLNFTKNFTQNFERNNIIF